VQLWNSKSLEDNKPALSNNNRKAVVEKVQKNLGKADRERERERERRRERESPGTRMNACILCTY
jgi:hypothetical protein